jgi:predicted O-methyltransferase YrrM
LFIVSAIGKLINRLLRPAGLALVRTTLCAPAALDTIARKNLPQLFFEDCRVLSNRIELLKALPRGGIVAEIGVADGDYSAKILSVNQPGTLHLIDAWDNERYSNGLERVRSKFKQEIAAGSVMLHHGRSFDVLPTLTQGSFDWVYLDTTHAYTDTVQELRLCASLVKDGGHIAGHDFCTGNPIIGYPYGVIQAVYEFCTKCRWTFVYIVLDGDGHFSFCLRQMISELSKTIK